MTATPMSQGKAKHLRNGDISYAFLVAARRAGVVALDLETSGLDWQTERIATCQLSVPGEMTVIVRMEATPPKMIVALLADQDIRKVFHHAMFDLRFMVFHWGAFPQNIACTKIAAKLLDRENKLSHSLKDLLQTYLAISVDKSEQLSNWFAPELTDEQVEYAINDVLYLAQLLATLEESLANENLLDLARACFAHIPTQVKLEVLGYQNVYGY